MDDQEIVGGGIGDGFLVSRNQYQGYLLAIEFRVDEATNSGVFVNCSDPAEISPVTCHEINIWDNHPRQEYRTGAIVTKVEPFKKLNTLGRWNTYEIRVSPDELEVVLNGTLISRLAQPEKNGGHIALQRAVDGEVRFRNIRLEAIN